MTTPTPRFAHGRSAPDAICLAHTQRAIAAFDRSTATHSQMVAWAEYAHWLDDVSTVMLSGLTNLSRPPKFGRAFTVFALDQSIDIYREESPLTMWSDVPHVRGFAMGDIDTIHDERDLILGTISRHPPLEDTLSAAPGVSAGQVTPASLTLAQHSTTHATRARARMLALSVPVGDDLHVDFSGVHAASPAFVDELLGALTPRFAALTIDCPHPSIATLIGRVIKRRDAAAQFVLHSPSG